MATPAQLIAYLRDCYEADNRETGIPNLLQSKHRHVAFSSGEDVFLSGLVSRVPIDQAAAEAAQKEAHLYRRDKTLIYAALMVVGPGSTANRLTKQVCAPLVFFPSEFTQSNDVLVLEPRLDDPRLNFPVLTALAGDSESAEVDSLQQEMPPLPWDRTDVHTIAAVLADMFPHVDFTPLARYPDLANEKEVRHAVENNDQLTCLPACAMALIPNSPDTRGVLFELGELSHSTKRSTALEALFNPDAAKISDPQGEAWPLAPAILSAAQQRALQSARNNTLTFVNGPPGTGKSYTIAAIALDHLSRGDSVLIASRNNQAVNVVADKIETLMGSSDSIVRAGRKEHLRQLKKSLEQLLGGVQRPRHDDVKAAKALRRELRGIDRQVSSTERALQSLLKRHVRWGALTESPAFSFFGRLAASARTRYLDWQLDQPSTTWTLIDNYHQLLERRMAVARELLRSSLDERVARLLKRRRKHLTKFLQAIRARGDTKQQRLFSEVNFRVLLHAFPVWLSKLSDLANVLPPTYELFDVAIIDEATQCDIASSLPLMQRAKRIVVVGDPKQLRHVSFLSDQRQQGFVTEHQLDNSQQERFHFRDKSVLDAIQESITQQSNVVFLNEHFRSLPQIIQFSNDEFYAGALNVMRQRPETVRLECVQLRCVAGKRQASGVNVEEASALIEELKSLVDQQKSQSQPASIGILSPFRDQVDHLQSRVSRALSHTDLDRHDMLIGTAHTFQGEERDTMLLSLVADPQSHSATFRFLGNPNVFNVSITRARHRQLVFTSLAADDTPSDSLLRRFFSQLTSPATIDEQDLHSHDTFRDEFAAAMRDRNHDVWINYPVAGITMDMIVQSSNAAAVGIDLVGYPGQLSNHYSLERYRMIERTGMRVIPLAYRDWKLSPSDCIAAVESKLG